MNKIVSSIKSGMLPCLLLCFALIAACGPKEDPVIAVTGVSLDQSSLTLDIGGTANLTATVSPSNATNKAVSWSTSNQSVATVNNGTVTAGAAGTVTITATVPKSKTVTISAKYVLEIGEGDSSSAVSQEGESSAIGGGGILHDDDDNTDLDLFSTTNDPMLIEYAKQQRNSSAASLLLGLIGWGLIVFAVGYIFSVVIRNHTPKLNVSPGSRRRYGAGSSGSFRSGSRLLPDRYYRGLKKY